MQTKNKKVLPFGEDLEGVKKYILKPGRHQFVPGSHAIHHNDNLTDEEAEWYLAKFPHIASIFDIIPKVITTKEDTACRVSDEDPLKQSMAKSVESKTKSVESQKIIYEDLSPPN